MVYDYSRERMMTMSKGIPQWIKNSKYKFCAVCGATDDLQYHHFVPRSRGGQTVPENILVLCAACHQTLHGQGGRTHHNELIRDGIARAKARGVRLGGKPANGERIIRLIAENSTQFNEGSLKTESEIMAEAGIKSVCYHKYKKVLIAAMNADEWPYDWPRPTMMRNRPLYDAVDRKSVV